MSMILSTYGKGNGRKRRLISWAAVVKPPYGPGGRARKYLDARDKYAYTSSMADFSRAARKIAGECPGIRVRRASRLLTRLYDEALRPLGIQASQLSVLIAVAMFGDSGAVLGSLAQALVM